MKRAFIAATFLLSLSFLSVCAQNKPDTIDSWHVLYNYKVIATFNPSTATPFVTLRIQTILAKDMLSVEYACDTPCKHCRTDLYVREDSLKRIEIAKGKGNSKPLKAPVVKLFNLWKARNYKPLDIFYVDDRRNRYIFQLTFSN